MYSAWCTEKVCDCYISFRFLVRGRGMDAEDATTWSRQHNVHHRPLLLSFFSFSGSRPWGDGMPKTLRHGLDNTTSTTGHFDIFFTSSFVFQGTKHAAIRGSSHTELRKSKKKERRRKKEEGKELREVDLEGRTGICLPRWVPRNLGCG